MEMDENENGEEFEPDFQRGRANVEHRNIDAAGGDHPFGEEPQSFEADLRHLIRKVADDLYKSWQATVREYLANAETATLKVEEYLEDPSTLPYDDLIVEEGYESKIEVTWNRREDKLVIKDNGIGMAAAEVDDIFRQIGHSAARDDGTKSGQFGMGALSFVKLVGLDNAMIMTSHSRINDDNAAYYVTLAGVEPIQGQLADDEYGTKFQMTPDDDFDIRSAVYTYAEWMRVPVIYREIDENGQEVNNEDWGDKALYDSYDQNRICLGMQKNDGFAAYCSPEASGETLLLSMDIDRNDGRHSPGQHGAPFQFDVRLLDESGKVIESSNGNEGLMPCPRSDYESMLVETRDPYIPESLLNNGDIIGQTVEAGPNEGATVVADAVLDADKPLPPADYVAKSDLSGDDEPGQAEVLIGPNQGKVLVSEDEWSSMDAGRADLYVPEDELREYDLETGCGDLCLPEPTSDRDRLQSHEKFWEYVGSRFASEFNDAVDDIYEKINGSDDALEAIMDLDEESFSLALMGIKKISAGRRRRASNMATVIEEEYGTDVSEDTAGTVRRLYKAQDGQKLVEMFEQLGHNNADYEALLSGIEDDDRWWDDGEANRADVLRAMDSSMSYGWVARNDTSGTKKSNRNTIYAPELASKADGGTVYMAKATSGAFVKKARIAWDLNDNNQVVVVDEYDKWKTLFGWEQLKKFPHGKNQIREQYGDELSDSVVEQVAPQNVSDDDDSDDSSDTTSTTRTRTKPTDEVLNVARGSRHRKRRKIQAKDIKDGFDDDGVISGYSGISRLILFPSDTDLLMTNHWWIPGSLGDGTYCAIANCNKGTYEYLSDCDEVLHVEDYLEKASEYEILTDKGTMTVPEAGDSLVLHVVTEQTRNRLMQDTVFEELPNALPKYFEENSYSQPEWPDEMTYAPVLREDTFWLRPMLKNNTKGEDGSPVVLKGNVGIRNFGSTWSCSSDYKLYSRARLPDWDWDWVEMEVLDDASYRIELNDGGFELIETLGQLHDMGEKPFSQTPKARWDTDAV